jgi:hypothetical protein
MATRETKTTAKKLLHEDKYSAVKIDKQLGKRLRLVATESNESVGDCLSRLAKEPIEREYAKIVRKFGDKAS